MDETNWEREARLKNGQMLTMRGPAPADADIMMEYLQKVGGESDNLLFGEGEFHLSLEEEAEYIENLLYNPDAHYVLAFIGDGLVGTSQIRCLGKSRNCHNAELGISVRKAHWGKGVGTAMMEEMLRFAREHGGIKNVHLGVRADNVNAIRLYDKFGFVIAGVHRDYFCINGEYFDEYLMDKKL